MSKSQRSSRNKPEAGPKAERPKSKVVVKQKADVGPKAIPANNKSDPLSHLGEIPKSKIQEKPTADRQPPINKMDVQHHPQLEHKPKPWKEYLLEGFMIFIAVMMGFIAENIRESIDNSEHAKQLTFQLMHDLKKDSSELDTVYQQETIIVKQEDSLFNLLQQPMAKIDTRKLQKLVSDAHSLWPFHPSAVAIAAIKNELHLKQFSNSEIISYIATYEKHIELLRTAQDITLIYQRNFLDPFLYQHFTPANLNATFSHTPQSTQMRNLTQDDLTQLGSQMVLVRINSNELLRDHRWLKADITALLNYVVKQYNLKED